MTTVHTIEVQCGICGESSTQVVIGSTNQMGSPDLDTRPPEMARSTIRYGVQRCASCNYCSADLSKCEAGADEIIKSTEYLEIVHDFEVVLDSRGKNVSAFYLADSLISEKQNHYAKAFWSALNAAWLCDDEGKAQIAEKCRTRSLDLLDRTTRNSEEISDQKGAAELIALDLMRRTKEFDEARELIVRIEQAEFEDIILKIARFQGELIRQRDVRAHTISDAIDS
jgi:hypothetical protein